MSTAMRLDPKIDHLLLCCRSFTPLLQRGMAPPTYADLGKAARDVFGKGFHFGLVKLDVKTKEQCINI